MPIGIYAVADKYDIPKIYEAAAEDIRNVLTSTNDDKFEMFQAAIHAHYGSGAGMDDSVGRIVTSVALQTCKAFVETVDLECVMKLYPMFGADVALSNHRQGKISLPDGLVRHNCFHCKTVWTADAVTI
jgi:hypothetical protein